MSSLAVRCGLEWELGWLGGLFTAAELAAADLLLQLSGDYEAAAAASTATASPSPRSASSRCEVLVKEEKVRIVEEKAPLSLGSLDRRARRSSASSGSEDLTVVGEEELEPPRIARETAPSSGSVELDRRARKRYRLLSELYAATRPVKAAAPAAKKKRKRHHDGGESESPSSEATRDATRS